jgi:hypothetical protein
MKFVLALMSLVASAAAKGFSQEVQFNDIKADSAFGQKVMSKARRLDDEVDFTWVAGFSIKFQGCHHISQWNDEADGEEDVRIQTKRLVRFRLCPSDYCSAESAKGCSEGYGDYIVDLNAYLEAFFEAKQQYNEFQCEYLENYVCGCDDDNNNNNNNNCDDCCLWDCFEAHNMDYICMEDNPYNNNNNNNQDDQFEFELDKYMECAEAGFDNDNYYYYQYMQNNGYYNNNNGGDNAELEFFIGPYCASQGGSVLLGVFTDETCTQFADSDGGRDTFYGMTGMSLPYSDANIVDMDCFPCKEPQENNNDGNDNQDADEVNEFCEQMYEQSGKCEGNLPYGTVYSPNTNACNYMEGIKIVRKDGTVVTADAKANKTASIFIGLFVVAFVLLSAYVYYLKTKLDRASINLAE